MAHYSEVSEELSLRWMSERPSIEGAVKNLISIRYGSDLTASSTDRESPGWMPGDDATEPLPATMSFSSQRACGGAVLRCFNAHEPPLMMEEDAAAARALAQAVRKRDGKVTTLLGRSYAKTVIAAIEERLLSAPPPNGATKEELAAFLGAFVASLNPGVDVGVSETCGVIEVDTAACRDNDLVWEPDFAAALRLRRDERVQAAAARVEAGALSAATVEDVTATES